jgi:hypothetical protein
MQTLEETLAQRQSVHGDYTENSERYCALVDALGPKLHTLPPQVRFGIHNICGKLARILSGDCTFTDHWLDIQGYAKKTNEANVMSPLEEETPPIKGWQYNCPKCKLPQSVGYDVAAHTCIFCGYLHTFNP